MPQTINSGGSAGTVGAALSFGGTSPDRANAYEYSGPGALQTEDIDVT